jgi:hypothetical protein
MGAPVKVTRDEHTAQDLRRIASDMKDAGQAGRVQVISLVMDGWSRDCFLGIAVAANPIPIYAHVFLRAGSLGF